ncbi:hypothetical protein [Sphingopyxis panaciterrae]
MADSGNYPQLPRNVWRGVWDILRKTPNRKLDEKALAAELAVQPTAAKAYSRELAKLGILNDDCTPTELAKLWRQDGQDAALIDQIIELAYPQELRELAPRDDLDRDKIVRWFMNEGLGEGSAKNKAATYIMVSGGISEEVDAVSAAPRRAAPAAATPAKGRAKPAKPTQTGDDNGAKGTDRKAERGQRRPDLNVNIQIHISADASAEQIDAIFSSMKRYFDEAD